MFSKIRCFYCNNWTTRPNGRQPLREFQCQRCTAVNYLDKAGKITDPPSHEDASPAPSVRYGHAPTQRSASPSEAGGRSASTVFCSTCLTNQHIRYESLKGIDAVTKEEDPMLWQKQQEHIRDLEERYPQVCPRCRPKARDAIKRANYLTRTWNMMISMQKTKSGEFAPVVEGRLWRSVLLLFGLFGREASIVGQSIWHLLGARVDMSSLREQPQASQPPVNPVSSIALLISCAGQTTVGETVNPWCFQVTAHWVSVLLVLAVSTIWWNNQLWAKYLNGKPGRLTHTTDYYVLQIFSLMIRAEAWWLLRNPQYFPFETILTLPNYHNLYRAAHLFMIALIGFCEVRSRYLVKLESRYPITIQRDEDILPDTPAVNGRRTNFPANHEVLDAPKWIPNKNPKQFNIASLSSSDKRQSPQDSFQPHQQGPSRVASGVKTPQVHSPKPDDMDWSPTPVNSATSSFAQPSYNLRSRQAPTYEKPQAPSLFSSDLFQALDVSSQPGHRAPNELAASARQPNSYGSQPRRTQKKHRKQPSTWDTASEVTTEVDSEDEKAEDTPGNWQRSTARNDFTMAQPKLWLNQDKVETGLENIFSSVFTINDANKQSKKKERNEPKSASPKPRGHGGMFGSQYDDQSTASTNGAARSIVPSRWLSASLLFVFVAIAAVSGYPMRFWAKYSSI